MKSLLFVLSQSPDSPLALEALDAVMTAVLFDQNPYVVFVGAGIQQYAHPNLAEKIAQLIELGLTQIYFNKTDQLLTQEQPIDARASFKALSAGETSTLLHQADKILSF